MARRSGGFLEEFKAFAISGNFLDLAVAVVLAGAFGAIVNSLIGDIITPLLLNPALKAAKVDELAKLSINGIKYGLFLSTVINFLVIAFVMFMIVKAANRMKREEAVEAGPTPEETLTTAINNLTDAMNRR
jgi:large conductance mechanosensitive channel